ncbi:MAG: mechanosensitive ion channel family protein, partial [candidate division NC10 bacterium]|nr:mechanosensitive ion channel family protein [candidate division NC10 bacterium]
GDIRLSLAAADVNIGVIYLVAVASLGDSSVVIRSLVRTQPGSQWNAAREFRRRIKNRFDREGIEIPFPQRTVHLKVEGETSSQAITAAGAAGR